MEDWYTFLYKKRFNINFPHYDSCNIRCYFISWLKLLHQKSQLYDFTIEAPYTNTSFQGEKKESS